MYLVVFVVLLVRINLRLKIVLSQNFATTIFPIIFVKYCYNFRPARTKFNFRTGDRILLRNYIVP